MLDLEKYKGIPHSQLCCFGLVHKIFQDNGIDIGNHTDRNFFENWEIIDEMNIRLFDIIYMEPPDGLTKHIGLYIGDGMMLHSMNKHGSKLIKVSLYKKWIKRIYRWKGSHGKDHI